MAAPLPEPALEALQQARDALERGDKQSARRWAWKAVKHAPEHEEPWLYLASVSSPYASAAYLRKVLEINPSSTRARRGLHWAAKRLRSEPQPHRSQKSLISLAISRDALIRNRPAFLPWSVTVLILVVGLLIWLWTPEFSSALQAPLYTPVSSAQPSQSQLQKATYTPSPTATSTPTPTPTPTNTPTPTATPTKTKKATPANRNSIMPPGVYPNERWFDLDLSQQRLYAYQGTKLIKTMVVSTGTWAHPTLTGQYQIYVKYRYAHMSGPGYYLPNVPYTMYYDRGYGIHGTYWHNNFGTPMSHGCVNLRTVDAKWAYQWASVGTTVNIHP
ncbi:MAG: L,D-transpeptidase family protein [Anaerolineales bacterium]